MHHSGFYDDGVEVSKRLTLETPVHPRGTAVAAATKARRTRALIMMIETICKTYKTFFYHRKPGDTN